MGESDILRRHWRDFASLRNAFKNHDIIVGVDRFFALSQILGFRTELPPGPRVAGWALLLSLSFLAFAAAWSLWSAMYIVAALCALAAWLLWLFLVKFAIRAVREAALRSERLFRRWFAGLRLSIFIKRSGEYVWNNAGTAQNG